MTQAEIEAQWARYMHRADLATDMASTWLYAREQIRDRLMFKPADPLLPDAELDEILASNPRIYLHSGLLYLQELAQDDVGMQREMVRFDGAISDYQMHRSILTPAIPTLYNGLELP